MPGMYSLTWYIYWRWILAALAFTILVPLVILVFEFPLMLLVAIISRMFGYPEFASSVLGVVNALIFRPEVLGSVFFAVGFFVLRAMLSKAIGAKLDGKVLVLQDAPESLQ
jgi:hypothetical protein